MKRIALFLLVTSLAWAGLPPTSTKFSTDSNPVTTFELDFPNATVTHTGVKASFGLLSVPGGGSGLASTTAYSLLAGGTTSTGALQQVSGVGSSGQVLTSNGASALPTWQASSPAFSGLTQFGTIYAGTSTTVLSTAAGSAGQPLVSNATSAPTYQTLGVSGGGHGVSSLTAYSLIAGGTTTTAAVQQIAAGSTTGQVLTYQGSSALPTWANPSTVSTVAAVYSLSSSSSPGSNTQINFDNKIIDTNSAVTTGVSWKFTVPSAGNYLVQMAGQTSSGTPDLFVYKNGTSTAKLFTMTTGSVQSSGSVILPFALNDTIDIRPNTGVTLAGSGVPYQTYVSIQLAPGGGNISTNSTSSWRLEGATFGGSCSTDLPSASCTSGTCVMCVNSGGISSITWASTGGYTVNFVSGTFSKTPVCTCACNQSPDCWCETGNYSTSGATKNNILIQTRNSAGTATNAEPSVQCMGPQ